MSSSDNPIRELLEPILGTVVPDSVSRRQARHDELAARVEAGTDPDYIDRFENFHSMEHAEIYQLTRTISPEAMNTLAREWAKLGSTFSLSITLGTTMIRDKIAQHWEGGAATAAASATQLFGESAQQLCDAANAVSQKLRIAADVGERVKSSIDPPSNYIPLPIDVVNPGSGADTARAAEAARIQAVRIMETLYKPYYRDSGSAVPTLPSPHAAATSSAGDGGTSPFGSHSGADRSGASTMSGFDNAARLPGGAAADAAGGTADGATDGAAGTSGADPYGSDRTGPDPSETNALPGSPERTATTPASTSPSSLTGNSTMSGQPYGSGSPGFGSTGNGTFGSSGSSGAGGGGGSALGSGALGGLGPGGLAAGSAPAAAQQGASGARSGAARPMGMFPGMMGGGAQRGNDEERRVANYLVNNDNGNELIGSMPDTAPPVFGVDPA
ncbi:hypothetical protein [Rhodococcus chondri]|uniref:PPE family domain-containing protein n=1 Tax=Rhodococcus chondri TaxID=3065941 RepID=A0ABU7JUB5_9NOCA|nr:hypothetical protein [Rhodococcus sp. CC-R104]MEE2033613.1 hypothetical protein [Rhodococcus sp. CC-R104]